ncbi:MAG: hypothetical protein ABIP50_01345 [Candidatus Saccharimonadales bacterium]
MTIIKKINNSSAKRLLIAVIVGIAVGTMSFAAGLGLISILIGWDAAVLSFIIWVWAIIWPMGHEQTARFALREDPVAPVSMWCSF